MRIIYTNGGVCTMPSKNDLESLSKWRKRNPNIPISIFEIDGEIVVQMLNVIEIHRKGKPSKRYRTAKGIVSQAMRIKKALRSMNASYTTRTYSFDNSCSRGLVVIIG